MDNTQLLPLEQLMQRKQKHEMRLLWLAFLFVVILYITVLVCVCGGLAMSNTSIAKYLHNIPIFFSFCNWSTCTTHYIHTYFVENFFFSENRTWRTKYILIYNIYLSYCCYYTYWLLLLYYLYILHLWSSSDWTMEPTNITKCQCYYSHSVIIYFEFFSICLTLISCTQKRKLIKRA